MKSFKLQIIVLLLLVISCFEFQQHAFASHESEQYSSFKQEISITDDPLKAWTIIGSKRFDEATVSAESVFILDDSGQSIPLKDITVNGSRITITPTIAYTFERTYTIYLKGTIQSKEGIPLKPMKFQFTVKKPAPKINLTANLQAQVKNPDHKQLSLNLLAKGQIVGGYETDVGQTILGYTIGTSTHTNSIVTVNEGDKNYYFLYDLTTNKLRAVYWELASASSYFNEWNQSASFEGSVAASELYVLLTNEFRAKENKSPVAYNEALAKAAYAHSKDMGTNNYFSHTSIDGRSLGDRVWALCSSCSAIGENIAANQMNVFLAHHGWINSPGHRSNLLNDSYTHIGFGLYYTNSATYNRYYTTNFGQIR